MKSAVDRGKKAIRILGFGLLVLALLARSNPVQCSGTFTGATEMTQLMNHVELVSQYLKQVEAYATQLQQYQTELKQLETMVTNLKNIPDQVWTAIFKDLQGVISIVKQGQALAFSASNISEEFQNKFKGFVQAANFQTDYKNWSNTVRDSIRTSLAAANLQSQQFASEERHSRSFGACPSRLKAECRLFRSGHRSPWNRWRSSRSSAHF